MRRSLAAVVMVVMLGGMGACRSPTRSSRAAPPEPLEPPRSDATPQLDCSAQLAAFRQHLAFAPIEDGWIGMNKNVPPSTKAPLEAIGAQYRPLITVSLGDIRWIGWTPIDGFDAAHFVDSLEHFYTKTDEPLLYVQVAEQAPLTGLRAVRDGLASAETRMHRTFVVGLLFRYSPEVFKPYDVPFAMPRWAYEEVLEFRRTERYNHNMPGFARRALLRAAPECPAAVEAGTVVTDMLAHDTTREGALVEALAACDCAHLDIDAFAGLVLGAIGYRNPYGYVRLATSPKAKYRIKVPLTGSMADIAAAWPTNAGDEAVWIDFE